MGGNDPLLKMEESVTHQPAPSDTQACPHAPSAIGAGYNPLDPQFRKDPYPFYARAQREAPVCQSPLFGFWIVTRHEDVVAVLKNPELFSSLPTMDPPVPYPPEVEAVLKEGYPLVPGMFNNDPPAHTRVRNLFTQAFTPRRVAQLEPRIRSIAHQLVDDFVKEGQADLIKRFAYKLPLQVICELLGIPQQDGEQCKAWHDDWIKLAITLGLSLEEKVACARSIVEYQRYYAALLAKRKADPRDDLTTAMVQARLDGEQPFTTAEMVWQMMVLLSGGHETTTYLISSMLYLLLQHPEQWKALDSDPSLIEAAVEETLRFEPPFPAMARITTAPTELGGVPIPKGARVHVFNAAANRDQEVWKHPDRYDICRDDPQRHLAFGFGVHYCIGAPLARMEGRIALEVLRQRLPGLRLCEGYVPEYAPSFFFRGLRDLPLQWNIA